MSKINHEIATATGLSYATVEQVLDQLHASVLANTRTGASTRTTLGTFSVKHRPARSARNPRTGEQVAVPAKNVLVFKPASTVKL